MYASLIIDPISQFFIQIANLRKHVQISDSLYNMPDRGFFAIAKTSANSHIFHNIKWNLCKNYMTCTRAIPFNFLSVRSNSLWT